MSRLGTGFGFNKQNIANENENENENLEENSQVKNFMKFLDKTKLQLVEEESINSNSNSLINENYVPLSKKDKDSIEKINRGKYIFSFF